MTKKNGSLEKAKRDGEGERQEEGRDRGERQKKTGLETGGGREGGQQTAKISVRRGRIVSDLGSTVSFRLCP